MGRPREGNYKTFTVNLDPNETDKFVQGLKHNQSLSEIFRDFIRDENRRIQSEKNLNAPCKGAIRIQESNYNIYYNKDKNLSLDVFSANKEEIHNTITSVDSLLEASRVHKRLSFARDTNLIHIRHLKGGPR